MNKKRVMLTLCLVAFVGGWVFHYFFTTLKPSVKIKAVQRQELRKTLRLKKGKPFDVIIIEEKVMENYTRRLLRFRWQGLSNDAYLLIPNQQKERTAAILAIHGHHTTKEEVVGVRQSRSGVDFGQRLVKSGFCVLAPDIPFSNDMNVEDHVALQLIMAGSNLTGIRVSYLKALIDYLVSLPFIDPERLGCVGWSMGGGLAMYLSAIDKRVKVVAISSYFGTYRNTFLRIRQSTDNYIPGILHFGEMPDVACLIAPKPLWLEHGEGDPEFPQDAFMKGIESLKNCYKGHEECLTWQLIPGGHRFEGKGLEEWFKQWL